MYLYSLVQKNAFFCTKELIVLYKRLFSFVQGNILSPRNFTPLASKQKKILFRYLNYQKRIFFVIPINKISIYLKSKT